jgi:hypothetical protein
VVVEGVCRHANGAGWRWNGRPRTKTRVTGTSCSTHSGPIVSVSQPGIVHFVTIGMSTRYPLGHSSNPSGAV